MGFRYNIKQLKPDFKAVEGYIDRFGRFDDGDDSSPIVMPMQYNILGKILKPCNINVYAIGRSGLIDQKVIELFNKFFVELPKLIESQKKLILDATNLDCQEDVPNTWDDVKKYFSHIQDCFVEYTYINVAGFSKGYHYVAHASLEWNSSPNDQYGRFDTEHGNGFAMIDGKFYMSKPGELY